MNSTNFQIKKKHFLYKAKIYYTKKFYFQKQND
jgi:hypothetical protein